MSVECEMSRTVPLFEFPFSISKSNPIAFGKILDKPTCNIYNNGDVECGCIITITVSDSLSGNPRITNEVTHEFMQFDGVGFMINDVIVIDTNYGKMRATLHRIGLKVNMLRYLTDDSTWIKLATGVNTLSYTDIHKNYDNTTINVAYTPLFGGV
ncbi:MAG: phage tail family protein, partial [Clostridia bacterium]|nr:phage tail family protein [Clostridia bacterium]